MLKRILISFLVLLIVFTGLGSNVYAEAAPKYIPNPELEEKPKLKLVEKRPVPKTPTKPVPGVAGLIMTLGTQIILSTDGGQKIYQQGAEKMQEIDLALYNAIESTGADFDAWYNEQTTYIGEGLATVLHNIIDYYDILTGKLNDVFLTNNYIGNISEDGLSITAYNKGYKLPYSRDDRPVVAYIGNYVYLSNGEPYIHIFYVLDRGSNEFRGYIAGFNVTTGLQSGAPQTLITTSSLSAILAPMQNHFLTYMNNHSSHLTDATHNWLDTTKSLGTTFTPEIVELPPLPSVEVAPAITQIGDTKYWEIEKPNPDYNPEIEVDPLNNPEFIPNYVPVENPSATPIPEYIPNPEAGTGTNPGDDIPPGLEPPFEPSPSNPFGLPGTFISCFLGLFKAIILYLIRLFNFVLTIPLTPMKTFNNGAFDWFRTSKFLGVYVYDVVSLMASVALGLGVFNKIKTIFGRG